VAGLITVSLAVIWCCALFVFLDYDGALRFAPRDSEILPLPPTLRLISADHCLGPRGSARACTAEFVVTAADRATRAVTVTRLVEHLRRLGWPLQPTHDAYSGCRRIGGILHWTSHCLVLDVNAEPTTLSRPRTLPRRSSSTSTTSGKINICVDPTHWRRAHSLVSARADTCPAAGRDVG
jgi:hypothetical protein